MPRSTLPPPPSSDLLLGLRQIGAAFGRTAETARRWIETEGLPARQLPDQTWVTSVGNLRSWIAAYQHEARDE